jgi:hypothetical protein
MVRTLIGFAAFAFSSGLRMGWRPFLGPRAAGLGDNSNIEAHGETRPSDTLRRGYEFI